MATQKIDPRQPDSTDVAVGRLVRALRMSRGLSQTDLGNRIGVTFQQVQKYESGGNRISMGRLARIAKMFGVSVPYLLAGSEQTTGVTSSARNIPDNAEAIQMLGLIGAQPLLKAFLAVPSKPASLRESIVQIVEHIAKPATAQTGQKRGKQR